MKKAITIKDIAKIAQVSESTVSRALRNNEVINKKTRERVQAIAKENNFKINAAARNLRLQKTNTIAVIILFNEKSGQSISDPFMLELLGTIADELTIQGYDMLLTTSKTTPGDWGNYYFESKRADGLIVIGQGEKDERIGLLAGENTPFVVWGLPDETKNYSTVGSDNIKGGYLAVSHLIAQGCKRIAFFGDIKHPEILARWQGYQQAHKEAGLIVDENLRTNLDFTSADGYKHAKNVFSKNVISADATFTGKNCPDALFAVSDAIALGAMKYFKESDIRMPEQVSIVGFDDIAQSEYAHPSLSTIKQNTKQGGVILVQNLLKKLKGEVIKTQLLEVELVKRESSAS
ncbi:LacI family DNA-binding transcriptional regulator [Pseudoalteromonas denitrificans]|nr:LacI family DNA-binding transcriptional regulator [Pseudoalteromonas denitrificans]